MANTSSFELNTSEFNSIHLHTNSSLREQCIEELALMISKESTLCEQISKYLPGVMCEKLIEYLKDNDLLNDDILKQVVNSNISRLIVNRSSSKNYISPEALHESILKCQDLEKLDCSGQSILSKTIDYITHRMKQDIKELDVRRCDLTNLQTKQILRCCTQLKTIDLSGNRFIQSDCFDLFNEKNFLTNTQYNEELFLLYNCIFDDFNICLQNDRLKRKHAPSLNYVINAKRQKSEKRKTYKQLKQKKHNKKNWKNKCMKEINLSGCIRINNDSIRSLAKIFLNLTTVNLSHCQRITDISCLIIQCPLISHLIIDDCPIITYEVTGNHLSRLKEISFSGKGQLTNGFCSWFKNCFDKLEVLKLRNKTINYEDGSFIDLIKGFSNLKILDLYGISLDSTFVTLLETHTNLRKSIVSLDLSFHEDVSVEELFGIASSKATPFLNLESFSFSGNQLPSNSTFNQEEIRLSFPSLRHLCINKSKIEKGISQVEIAKVLSCFPDLTSIEIWCCSTISSLLLAIIPSILKSIKRVILCSKDVSLSQQTFNLESKSKAQELPLLNQNQLEIIQRTFPAVEYILWKHTVNGFRSFQHINPNYLKLDANILKINVEPFRDAFKTQLYVDDIPIWANENNVSLDNLNSVLEKSNDFGGDIPLVEDWCCDCNIDDYNGVLYYQDEEHIYWEVYEPGPKCVYKFQKKQYQEEVLRALEKRRDILDF